MLSNLFVDFCVILVNKLNAMNLHLIIAFIVSQRFWKFCHYSHLHQNIFISFLISSAIHWSFNSIIFSLQVLVYILFFVLSLISNFIQLRYDRMQDIPSTFFLYLLRTELWPKMWSIWRGSLSPESLFNPW